MRKPGEVISLSGKDNSLIAELGWESSILTFNPMFYFTRNWEANTIHWLSGVDNQIWINQIPAFDL